MIQCGAKATQSLDQRARDRGHLVARKAAVMTGDPSRTPTRFLPRATAARTLRGRQTAVFAFPKLGNIIEEM